MNPSKPDDLPVIDMPVENLAMPFTGDRQRQHEPPKDDDPRAMVEVGTTERWISYKTDVKVNDGVKVKMRGNTLFMFCPGCNTIHCVDTYQGERRYSTWGGKPKNYDLKNQAGEYSKDIGWWFNGDTIYPSLGVSVIENGHVKGKRCHFFIENGAFHYCGDCDHRYASHDVEMPRIEDWFKNPALNAIKRQYFVQKVDKDGEPIYPGEWSLLD